MPSTVFDCCLRFCTISLMLVTGYQPVLAQQDKTLRTEDMIAIQQLVNKFNFALDYCTAGGEDFANLFSTDGEYIIDMGDGMPTVRNTRAALINLAGGPDCESRVTPPSSYILHYSASLIIEPEAEPEAEPKTEPAYDSDIESARGISYAIYPANKGQVFSEEIAGQVGIYHDVYIKTSAGWRFQSRRHELNPIAGELEL